MDTRVYTLLTIQGNAARECSSREFEPPVGTFHVQIDRVGPLPVSSGFRYCLIAIDRYTRWPEAFPLSDITAEAVAKAFVSAWLLVSAAPSKS